MQAHKRVVDKPITEVREAGICMRENSFYVDTVRRSVQCLLYSYSFLFLRDIPLYFLIAWTYGIGCQSVYMVIFHGANCSSVLY